MFSCVTAAAPGRDATASSRVDPVLELTQRQKEMLICAALLGELAHSAGDDRAAGDYYRRAKAGLLDGLSAAQGATGLAAPDTTALRQDLESGALRYAKRASSLFSINAGLCESRYAH